MTSIAYTKTTPSAAELRQTAAAVARCEAGVHEAKIALNKATRRLEAAHVFEMATLAHNYIRNDEQVPFRIRQKVASLNSQMASFDSPAVDLDLLMTRVIVAHRELIGDDELPDYQSEQLESLLPRMQYIVSAPLQSFGGSL